MLDSMSELTLQCIVGLNLHLILAYTRMQHLNEANKARKYASYLMLCKLGKKAVQRKYIHKAQPGLEPTTLICTLWFQSQVLTD